MPGIRLGAVRRAGIWVPRRAAAPGYVDAVLATAGLQSYWRLAEAAGSMVDSKGAIAGTVSGGTRASTGLLGHDTDKCWTAGVGDYVDFGANYGFGGNAPFSFEWLMNLTAFGNGSMIGRHDGNTQGCIVNMTLGGGLNCYRNANNVSLAAGAFATGTTYHCVVTYDGSQYRVYRNGSLVAGPTTLSDSVVVPGGVNFRLNKSAAWGNVSAGRFDELAVYNVALSAATILAHAGLV